MSLADTAKIDFIGIGANGNCVLTVIDDMDWGHTPEHLATLQDKLNTYLRFVASGAMSADYPDSRDRQTEITIVLRFTPPREGLDFLQAAHRQMKDAGIVLTWRVFDALTGGTMPGNIG